MNVLAVLIAAAAAFVLAGRFYSRFIARRLGEDPSRPTPAVALRDDRDFVPTKVPVVFAHHFSAIAGAGPILGPTMAVLYGFVPAWLWVLLGGIFIGAVHDFTALFVSLREDGRSVAEIARRTLGERGFHLFIAFTLIMIVLVTSSFLSATSISLTSLWPLEKIGVREGGTFLRTVVVDGVPMGRIGGIASMSVIVITLCSPLLGFLIHRKGVKMTVAYPMAAAIGVTSVFLGIAFPVTVSASAWMIIISVYVLFAAGLPVWLILQPRDFINVQILYAGIALMAVSLVRTGLAGVRVTMPGFNLAEGVRALGSIWPMMFCMIACGAISGFHALVAGGTTSKQLSRESHARIVGYNGMLLESLLAVCVLLAIGAFLSFGDYRSIVWPTEPGIKSNPILGFSLAAGHLFNRGLGIPTALGTVFGILLVEGFVVTTLDAAVRLNRYLFEELWEILFRKVPGFLRKHWINAGISVLLMWCLAASNTFTLLWPVFGTANQLLAAMSLLAVSAWLMLRRRRAWFTEIPAVFMLATTIASLAILFRQYLRTKNYVLAAADAALFVLAAGVVVLTVRLLRKERRRKRPDPEPTRAQRSVS